MRLVIRLVAAASLAALAACDSSIEPEGAAASTPAKSAGPSDDLPARGSTSTLGKAKESAQGAVDKLGERQQEIVKELEGGG